MTDLRFTLPAWLEAGRARGVQVDVMDSRLLHKGRAEVSGSVKVSEPGTYAATARLPDGRQLQGTVKVAKNDVDAVIELAGLPSAAARARELLDAFDAGANLFAAVVRKPAAAPEPAAEITLPDERAKLRIASGNDWTERTAFRSPEPPATTGSDVSFLVHARNALQTLELYRAGEPTIFVQLPVDQGSEVTVEMRDTDAGWLPHVRYPDPDLELLIGYVSCGLYGEAVKVGDRLRDAARAFVQEKADHPIGACVGFYLSLRIGATDVQPRWAENLARLFGWLPDALVIHAEMLARNGEHRAARAALLELPKRGLPLFAVGLSYALDRLLQYQHVDAAKRQEPDQSVRALLDRLLAVSEAALPRRPILTYSGAICDRAAYDALDGLELVAPQRMSDLPWEMSLAKMERDAIWKALARSHDRTKAAKTLGINLRTLEHQIKKYDVEQD